MKNNWTFNLNKQIHNHSEDLPDPLGYAKGSTVDIIEGEKRQAEMKTLIENVNKYKKIIFFITILEIMAIFNWWRKSNLNGSYYDVDFGKFIKYIYYNYDFFHYYATS